MKALNKIWMAALAAVAMTACNNELSEQALNNGGNVNFTMGIGNTPSSRVSMPEDSYRASFTANDEVGIFVADVPSYTNVKYSTTDGTTWTGGPVNVSADAAYTYYAYYPYSESMVVNDIPVVVATNQDTDGYIKNDYLYSKLAATAGQKDVNLTFSHALSLVEVTLAGSGAAEGATVDLLNVAIDATIDLTAENLVTTGTNTATVTMDALSNLKFRAIVPAQDIAASTPVFKIASGGRTYQAKYSDVMNFEQGKYLAMTITLGEQGGDDDADIEITASASINDWTAGTSNGGGASISVTELSIPLPTDGQVLETIALNWSPSTPANQIGADKAEGWYKRSGFTTGSNPVSITSPAEIGYDEAEQALTIKRFSDSNGGWNNNPVVFHSCAPFDRGVYELSFEFKDDGTDADFGALGVGLSSSNDNKLFKMLNKEGTGEDTESLVDWSRTLTIFTATAAWTTKTVYFSLGQAAKEGRSGGSQVPTYDATTDDDVNKGVNIIFYNNKSGAETTLYVRNIKLAKSNLTYTEE